MTGPLDESKTKELVQTTLEDQLRSENLRFIYDSRFRCLIVSAPQGMQRQVESLLDQLEKILVSDPVAGSTN